MTTPVLLDKLKGIEARRDKDILSVKEKYDRQRKEVLGAWLSSHARFKIGDVISTPHSYDRGRDYIRIEEIEGFAADSAGTGVTPEIWYTGKQLLPDFTESTTRCRGIVIDQDGRRKDILKLDSPLYSSFTVSSASGEKTSGSYLEAIAFCRANSRKGEDSTVFGIDAAGGRTRILFVPTAFPGKN